MSLIHYQAGVLHAEDIALDRIADEVGTPFYCYSSTKIEQNYTEFAEAFTNQNVIDCYSVKANSNLAVLDTFVKQGAGVDVVSEGELRRALKVGTDRNQIVFSGVGKTLDELSYALDQDILQINVESVSELEMLSGIAAGRGQSVEIALRVNPDIDAGTHAKITTGVRANKFGIPIKDVVDVFTKAMELPGIEPVSLALHIGSQLTTLSPYEEAFEALASLTQTLRAKGCTINRLDLGGGLGVVYDDENVPSVSEYAAIINRTVGHLGCKLILEPGRFLVANTGLLVSQIVHVKLEDEKPILVVDAAMNDLMRPALYDAYHAILPIHAEPDSNISISCDVVGPICESSDTFAKSRPLPPVSKGDLLAFLSAGAYGAVMASTYNSRRLVPEVMVRGASFAIVRSRPNYDDMLALEHLPQWHLSSSYNKGT